jgi:hypothetical protein
MHFLLLSKKSSADISQANEILGLVGLNGLRSNEFISEGSDQLVAAEIDLPDNRLAVEAGRLDVVCRIARGILESLIHLFDLRKHLFHLSQALGTTQKSI